VCLPCAISKALTSITIPLLSLEGPGGAFDAPKVKCPPDRGSSDCVTGSPASIYSQYSLASSPESTHISKISPEQYHNGSFTSHRFPISTTSPRDIPGRQNSDLSTPPLTPDDGSDSSFNESFTTALDSTFRHYQDGDALDFLVTLFPRHGVGALPHAKSVQISAPNMGSSFDGVVLSLPGKPKTLYVDGKSAESVSLRESIVALLDLADESLQCNALIIVLERSSPNLGNLLHSLMYVGGTVVTKPPFPVDPAFVMVGVEI